MNTETKGQFHNLWPLYIGEFFNHEHLLIKDELIDFFKNYEEKNPKGNEQKDFGDKGIVNSNLYMSNFNLLSKNQDNKALKELFQFIAKSVLATSKTANKIHIENLKSENPKFNVNVKESWFIRYNKEGLVFPHTHGGSWNCVYYVKIGEDAGIKNGSTFFLRPYSGGTKDDFGSKYLTKDTAVFEPQEGKLLIWPNFIYHGSHPYKGEENKIIVSANLTVDLTKN